MYLRVVDRTQDGIVVRGAKAHTSGSVVSNELVIIPQRAMREADADYAVAFAVPIDTAGLKLVCRALQRRPVDEFEQPVSSHDDLVESFTIFDDVFVPWERVFMCGEWEYAGAVADTFANVNRQGYLGADVGKLRLFIGAAQLVAELNGVADVSHVRDKITQMIRLERSVWACGVAASLESSLAEPGFAIPDPVLTNAGKNICVEGHYQAARFLLEIAGGSVVTAPYVEDVNHPRAPSLVEKYYRGAAPDDAMLRLRVMKLIRDLVASEYGGLLVHGDHPRLGLARRRDDPDVSGDRPRRMQAARARRASGPRGRRRAPRRPRGGLGAGLIGSGSSLSYEHKDAAVLMC